MPIGRRGRPRPAPTWGPGRRGGSDAKPGAALNTRSRSHRAPPSHLLVLSASCHHLPPSPARLFNLPPFCFPLLFLHGGSNSLPRPRTARGPHRGAHRHRGAHHRGAEPPWDCSPRRPAACVRPADTGRAPVQSAWENVGPRSLEPHGERSA